MLGFLLTVSTVWISAHALVAWRLVAPLGLAPIAAWGSVAGGAAVGAAWIALMIATRVSVRGDAGGSVAGALRVGVWLWFGAFSVLVVALLAREAVVPLVRMLVTDMPPAIPGRRDLLGLGANAVVLAATAGATVAAVRGGTRLAPVVRVELPVAGLHPDLDGYRIVQLTDIHVAQPLTRQDLEAIVARTNTLEPDLIAITGDLVDARVETLASEVEPVFGLSARDGVWFVTGNHEYYSGARGWTEWLDRGGIRVLTNENRAVRRGTATLLVGGVTDYTAGQFYPEDASDPHKAMAGAPESDFKLLLAHQPKSVPAARAAGWNLQLSGHTHGGQYAPFTFMIDWFHPVSSGLTRMGDFAVYVSRGTGVWGPPMRLGAPNEITEIVLRRA